MKIKTITCHNVYNYGATLQAYALQTYMEGLGHQIEIINYYPRYRNKRTFFWKIPNNSKVGKYSQKSFFVHLLYAIYRAVKYYRSTNSGRRRKFDEFDRRYLHITSIKYRSNQQLKDTPPIADCYIAGSDQIWNPRETHMDPAFFLNFGKEETKRISYAASFGISEIEKSLKPTLKEYIRVLDAISVREKTGLDILNDLGYTDAIQVCDPVFLLSKEQWLNLATPSLFQYDYVLVYVFFHDDEKIKMLAQKLAKNKNYKIVSVNDGGECRYADVNINNASPNDFLSLIANARVVISNSFHATAFSLILNKEFYTYPVARNRNHSRMIDLLNSVDLLKRFDVPASSSTADINWESVNERIKAKVDYSKDFLANI